MADETTLINYSLFPRLLSSHPNFMTPCEGLVMPTNLVCYGAKYAQQYLLEPIGEPIYPIFEPIYQFLDEKGSSIGLKADQTIFILMLFLTYFWSFVYRMIFNNKVMRNNIFLKMVFLCALGLFYAIFTFGYEGFHGVACSFFSYLMMAVLPKSIAPKLVFAFVWTYLSVAHFIRMQTDFTSQRVDYSAMLMMMVLRINSCAFNYADGLNPNAKEELDEELVKASVSELPSFMEYVSYCFYYPALLSGPPFDLKYFRHYLRNYDLDYIPFSLSGFFYNLGMIVVSFIGFTQIDRFDREFIMYHREEFAAMSLIAKFFFIVLVVEFFRFRYYLVWHMAQGSAWLAGFGYDPEKKDWSAVSQIDFWRFELATSPYLLSIHWNIGVHKWVKKYVYLRNKKKGAKPGTKELFETFLVIAFWHGFYPGYYLFFVLCGIGVEFGRMFRNLLRRHVVPENYKFDIYKPIESMKYITPTIAIYNILGYFFTQAMTNYIGCSFVLLSVEHSIFIWKETLGGPVFIGLFIYVILKFALNKSATSTEKLKKQ